MRGPAEYRSGAKRIFRNQQIASVIEHVIEKGLSMRATAVIFNCSPKTVQYYINKYYYGITEGKTMQVTIESSMNEMCDIEEEIAV